MAWLTAERDTPSSAAARVKLWCRATVEKVTSALMVSRSIGEFPSRRHAEFAT